MTRFTLVACAVLALTACGSEESANNANTNANNAIEEGWWFEVDVLDIGRIEGNLVLVQRLTIRGADTGLERTGSFSLVAIDQDWSAPGTYLVASISDWVDSIDPQHRCRTTGEVPIEVVSASPVFEATFSGEIECWAGEESRPDDPDNPGTRLPGTIGTVTGWVSVEIDG